MNICEYTQMLDKKKIQFSEEAQEELRTMEAVCLEVLDLLEGASRGLISRGGLPAHSFRDMVEVNVVGGEEALHVVLSMEDGLFAVYQDPDWSYAIREGEALAAAVEALLPA